MKQYEMLTYRDRRRNQMLESGKAGIEVEGGICEYASRSIEARGAGSITGRKHREV